MAEDARFEDAAARPLYLGAMDPDDLAILSALVQDAVLPASEIAWQPRARRLALLVNRLRREERPSGAPERVQSVLAIGSVLRVSSQGVPRGDKDTVLQLLSLGFEPGADGVGGYVDLVLAGDGAIRAEVEALDVTLKDVTRPYGAPSGRLPEHPE
jgi:hypothetical protein